MANDEQLVIDIIVNGEKARVLLDQVKKETDQVGDKATGAGKKVDKATGRMTKAWKAVRTSILAVVGVAVAAVGSMGLMVKQSLDLSKATFGLTDSMKSWITAQSAATGMNEKMIASFVQTGKSAGMADATTKDMIDSALALSRAFPEESIETFIDNLVMLNTSGEAQGYIVDVMEQKWGLLDLKGKTLAEKLELIASVTEGVNEKFDATAGAQMDKVFNHIAIAARQLGTEIVTLAEKWGLLDSANAALEKMIRGLKTVEEMSVKELNSEMKELAAEIVDMESMMNTVYGIKRIFTPNDKLWGLKKELIALQALSVQKVKDVAADKLKKEKDQKAAQDRIDALAEETEAKRLGVEAEKALKQGGIDFVKRLDQEAADAKKKLLDEVAAKQKILDDEQSQRMTIATNHMTKSFMDMAFNGKASFKDMAEAILKDLTRMIVRQQIFTALKAATGGISGLFGLHTGTDEVKHSGGIIGGIPSHHSGSTRSDERIARLQVGEAVVNRAGASRNKGAIAQMNKGQQVGGQTIQQTTAEITFNVQAIDSASFNNYLVGNRQTIEGIINRSLTTNGSVRQTIKQVV